MIRTAAVVVALLGAAPALAQEEICSGDVNLAEFAAAMDVVDAAIEKADVDEARYLMQQMHPKVPCLIEPASPELLARYGVQRAMVGFFDQDEAAVIRWGLFATYVHPDNMPWPDSIDEMHPLRDTLSMVDKPEKLAVPGRGLAAPKGGAAVLNGQLAGQPAWYVEVPALIQTFDKKGVKVGGQWIDGTAFPEETMVWGYEEPEPPKWWTGPVQQPVDVDPSLIPEPPDGQKTSKPKGDGPNVARLAIGGGTAVVAGTLYLVAGLTAGSLDQATTPDELAATRSRANLLVVGSGVFAAGALGVGVSAFIDDGPGLALVGRF